MSYRQIWPKPEPLCMRCYLKNIVQSRVLYYQRIPFHYNLAHNKIPFRTPKNTFNIVLTY